MHERTQNANISVGPVGGPAELGNRNLLHCQSECDDKLKYCTVRATAITDWTADWTAGMNYEKINFL